MDEDGNSIVTIFGQEEYPDTAGLAKMNFILHNKGTGEIKSRNTLASPQYPDEFGALKKFDFIVMNPPFSDKAWTDGIKPSNDKYKRFDDYGIPPEKNGDYTWFLHILKSLNQTGKADIVMPHGVLFIVNAEETICKQILARDSLLNYWNEKLHDDVYVIKVSGYEASHEIDYEYAKKKTKDETVSVDVTSKVKSFDGALIPRDIIERTYFANECAAMIWICSVTFSLLSPITPPVPLRNMARKTLKE